MPQRDHQQVLRVVYGLMAGMFLAAMEVTIVATAAPTIVEDLGGLELVSWLFTAYLLTTTVSSPLWGKLSDLVGRRPVYLTAIGVFIGGSLLCGASQSMVQLIVSRGVQGIGGGGLTSLSFAIMADVIAPRQRGRYSGYMSAVFAAASVLGPLVGGFLVETFHWRSIFLLNVPLGLAAAVVSSSALKGVGGRRPARLDIGGAVTLSAAIVSLLLVAVWGGNEFAWSSPMIIGLLLGAVGLLTAFVLIEQRVPEPVIAMRLMRNRTLVIALVIALTTSVPFQAAIVYLPLFMQVVRGASVSGSGLLLVPLMVMMSVGAIAAGRRVTATGRYRRLLLAGLVLLALVDVWVATIGSGTTTAAVFAMMVVFGFAFGAVSPVTNLVAQNAMPVADLGAASSAMMMVRSLGSTLGIAAVGSVLVNQLRSGVADLPGGEQLDATVLAAGPETIAGLAEPLRSSVVAVLADAIGAAMGVGVPLLVVAVVVWRLLPELPLRDHVAAEIDLPQPVAADD